MGYYDKDIKNVKAILKSFKNGGSAEDKAYWEKKLNTLISKQTSANDFKKYEKNYYKGVKAWRGK